MEAALITELALRPDASDTLLEFGDRSVATVSRREGQGGLFLYVVAWRDREEASTVPHMRSQQIDLALAAPGDDWDYLNGDGMVLVRENHCILMASSGLSARSIENYLDKVLGNEVAFELLEVGNLSALEQVAQEGMKEISLDMMQFNASYDDTIQEETILQRLKRQFIASLVEGPEDRRRIQEAENVSVRLLIRLDTRRREGITAEELGESLRPALSEEPEGLTLVTGAGHRFRHGDLVLRKPVNVEAYGQTVYHGHAWELMQEYLEELERSGLLER